MNTSANLGTRILLAEADADFREFLASTLREDGHDVIEVSDGADLLALAMSWIRDAEPPLGRVIISEEALPGFSGVEVLSSFRAVDRCTPFILVVGLGDSHTRNKARLLGATVVFEKPFDVDALRAVVLKLLRGPIRSPRYVADT